MSRSKRVALIRVSVAATVAIAAFAWAMLGHERARWPKILHIGTAGPGGAYAKLGEGLAGFLTLDLPGVECRAVNTAGSVTNLQMLHQGKIDFAFVQSDVRGADSIRNVAKLYGEVLHVVVNKSRFSSPPRTIRDLHGKTLGIGPKGSGTRFTVLRLLNYLGIEFLDAYAAWDLRSTADAARAFERGEVDALFYLAGVPDENVERLLQPSNVVLIDVDDLEGYLDRTTGYGTTTIRRGVYGNNRPARDVKSIGVTALLVTCDSMDTSLVREVTHTLFARKADLAAIHTAAKQIGKQSDLLVQPHADHPGAAAYYENEKPSLRSRLERPLAFIISAFSFLFGLATMLRHRQQVLRQARTEASLETARAADRDHDVFIAYSSKSEDGTKLTLDIATALEEQGFSCWFAPRNIKAGANWSEAIPSAIESTKRAFVLVFTGEANESEHLAIELTLAAEAGLSIVPFFAEDVEPAGTIKYRTAHMQRIHGFPGQREEGIGLLLHAVEKIEVPEEESPDVLTEASPEVPEDEPVTEVGQAWEPETAPARRKLLSVLVTTTPAAVLLIALWLWGPSVAPGVPVLPELDRPADGAVLIGSPPEYHWEFSGHDPTTEYEIERWRQGGEPVVWRVTARTWPEKDPALRGKISWRVRAIRQSPDGARKPTHWSHTRTYTYYSDTLERIRDTGRVFVAMNGDSAHYFDAEGQPTFLETELVRIALEEDLRSRPDGPQMLEIVRRYRTWPTELFSSLDTAECDLMTASITIKEEREKAWRVRFTDPVTVEPPAFVHRPSLTVDFKTPDSARILIVGARVKTTHAGLAESLREHGRPVRVQLFRKENAHFKMYEALVKGEVDLLLFDRPVARSIVEAGRKRGQMLALTTVDELVMDDPPVERIGVATKPFDQPLRDLLNKAIEAHADEIEKMKDSLSPRVPF